VLALIGTIPNNEFPLVSGEATLTNSDDCLSVQGHEFSINRGTPALIAAAVAACKTLGASMPYCFLVGDEGTGQGSRKLYEHLTHHLASMHADVIAFHYLQPDVDWHNRILLSFGDEGPLPLLIADAGYMYVAKMSGFAASYDLFTPDVGELAFLADERAPHPFYTRGFILHEENKVPDLVNRAFLAQNAAKTLLVKGATDYIYTEEGVVATVDHPKVRFLEPIGGTGDTLTGLVALLAYAGYPLIEAATLAAITNRLAGELADPDPATQVCEIIRHIPKALQQVLASTGQVSRAILRQ
jgi:hypothetical protein